MPQAALAAWRSRSVHLMAFLSAVLGGNAAARHQRRGAEPALLLTVAICSVLAYRDTEHATDRDDDYPRQSKPWRRWAVSLMAVMRHAAHFTELALGPRPGAAAWGHGSGSSAAAGGARAGVRYSADADRSHDG
jgi:hypothetical protein